MVVLSRKTFNKPSRPNSVGASSSSRPRVGERTNEEEKDEEAQGDDESSEENESDNEGPNIHLQIAEIAIQMGKLQTQQRQFLAKQYMEESRRHQDLVNNFIRYQVVFNAYMTSGQSGDPPTFPLLCPLPPPDHPYCTFMTKKGVSSS